MKIASYGVAALLALMLNACGSEISVPKAAKKAKGFDGSKLAPPPADMNYHAGWAMMVERYDYLEGDCKDRMNPARIPEECKAGLDAIASKSTFEPYSCRTGDERSHKWDLLTNPVSCNGRVSTPPFETDALVVFHQVAGEWYARIDDYSRQGMIER